MDERTIYAVAGQTPVKRKEPQRLGDTLFKLMEGHIAPRRDRLQQVAQLWQQLLTPELVKNSRIDSIEGGTLKVVAKTPAHLFELRLCSSKLLSELAACCPKAKIQSIDIAIG